MQCPTCDQAVDNDSGVAFGVHFEKYIEWYQAAGDRTGEIYYLGNEEVRKVMESVVYDESQGDDDRPVFMVFDYRGGFYKKEGTADSYGRVQWNGPVKKVVPVTKTVETFE